MHSQRFRRQNFRISPRAGLSWSERFMPLRGYAGATHVGIDSMRKSAGGQRYFATLVTEATTDVQGNLGREGGTEGWALV